MKRYNNFFESSHSLENDIKRLIPKIVKVAQKVYDFNQKSDDSIEA